MKVYLASEDKTILIRLANIINKGGNSCIMSDAEADGYKGILRDMRNAVGNFDIMLLVSGSPAAAAIEANRVDGFRASVCKNHEDAVDAASAKANLIVLDLSRIHTIDINSILEECGAQRGAGRHREAAEKVTRTSTGTAGAGFKSPLRGIFGYGRARTPDKNAEKNGYDADAAPQQRRKGRGGILDSIKDTFGVED